MRARTIALTAVLLLICGDLIDAGTRPGYDPARHWVSHLALGDQGWLGSGKLVAAGLLLVGLAVALRAAPLRDTIRPWTRGLVGLVGIGLLAAAAFPIDPGMDYPPGAPAGQSWRGGVHDVAGALTFLALTVSSWRLGRDLGASTGRPRWRRVGRLVAVWVVLAFVTCSALVAMDFAGTAETPSGLFERLALYAGVAWLGAAVWLATATTVESRRCR